jgi:hypothetical protein
MRQSHQLSSWLPAFSTHVSSNFMSSIAHCKTLM